MDMVRIPVESISTHLDGIEEKFQAQLANIRSENDAKVNDLMEEIRNLKHLVATEIARRRSSDDHVRKYIKRQTEADDKLSAAFKAWFDAKRSPKQIKRPSPSRWEDGPDENSKKAKCVACRGPLQSQEAGLKPLPL